MENLGKLDFFAVMDFEGNKFEPLELIKCSNFYWSY